MSPVSEHADNFSGQSFIQNFNCSLAVDCIAFRYGAILDVLASAFPQSLDVGKKWFVSHSLCSWLVSHGITPDIRLGED
jgi:hypothetical protein